MKNDDATAHQQSTTTAATQVAHGAAIENKTVSATDIPIGKGATLLDLYKVESDPIVGGMGRVFRIRHTGWNTDLAMKQPKKELFRNEAQKQAFIHECDAWINLGLHPHIVSCYYVREIGGIPSIFSEWMDGGSLKGFIDSGALYEDDEAALERILDISIQFARGLRYAHEQLLIHQDVKPDNLLLSKTGEAKVADFGLANAKNMLGAEAGNVSSGTGTIISKSGGYTPAYCSPEQAGEKELTRRTDVWSWAVSVLEMFVGERPWNNGVVAGLACEDYFDMARILIPEAMKDLLRHCFKEDEAERPHDFKEIETVLLQIYHDSTGKAYPRPEPKAAANTADSLNNKALSYLDLGKPEEAEKCWEQALTVDSSHNDSLYNRSVHLWQNAKIDDLEAIRLLSTNAVNADYHLAKLHIVRGDAETAIECLNKAKEMQGETEEIKSMFAKIADIVEKRKDGKCLKTFELDHYDSVYSVCFSPDSNQVIMGGGKIYIWDLSGKHINTFEKDEYYIGSVSVSPDNREIVSGCRKMKLWDRATGQCVQIFEGHKADSRSIGTTNIRACFSPDGKMIISGGEDYMIKLWDTNTRTCIKTLNGHTEYIISVSVNKDGTLVLSGSRDGKMKLWDVRSGECIRTFEDWKLSAACFCPCGKMVISAGRTGITVWDIHTGEKIKSFNSHGDVSSVNINADGTIIISGNRDETAKIWDITTGRCIRTFGLHKASHTNSPVCFSPDGKKALSINKLWSVPEPGIFEFVISHIHTTEASNTKKDLFNLFTTEINGLVEKTQIQEALNKLEQLREIRLFSNDETYFELTKKIARYCILGNNVINQTVQLVEDTSVGLYSFRSVCLSPCGNNVLIGCENDTILGNKNNWIVLWDIANKKRLRSFQDDPGILTFFLNFNVDGNTFISVSNNKKIKLWDVSSGACIHTFSAPESISRACLSPDGSVIASGGSDGIIRLWDVETGECIRTITEQTSIGSICFSPDGTMILTNNLNLWDANLGKCIYTYGSDGRNRGACTYACFSPDGSKILASERNLICLLNLYDERPIRIFKGEFRSCCFSPNGENILLAYSDNSMQLWNTKTGKCVKTLLNNTFIDNVFFSLDGTKIGMKDKRQVTIYTIEWDMIFPGWVDWDEGAHPYLDIFLKLHPHWTNGDFDNTLIPDLQRRGYGWLRPEGVKVKLEEMSQRSFWQRLIGAKN
jgi:WD40 repeat protein